MTKLRITSAQPTKHDDKWRNWGVERNPFPESGVGHGVNYEDHLIDGQLETISDWLQHALDTHETQWRPLALKGSIGVGKTHWLWTIEELVQSHEREQRLNGKIFISRHTLTDAGMRSLNLGSLMHEGLTRSSIIERTLRAFREESWSDSVQPELGTASPLYAPLDKLAHCADKDVEEQIDLFRSWLLRSRLSPTKLDRLGVNDRLDLESIWVRAQAHLCRLAGQVMGFLGWFLLIDQLEDLWRRGVTTPLRRARFLSELRSLIDEAYEGAPIAVGMAWNTTVTNTGRGTPPDIERQLQKDYYSLFTRIHGDRVLEFVGLPREHALPFARAYIDKVARSESTEGTQPLLHYLTGELSSLLDSIGPEREIMPRQWLQILHRWATKLPDQPPDNVKRTLQLPRS
jgi:hypothetical protein